jgi:hypothetical protein
MARRGRRLVRSGACAALLVAAIACGGGEEAKPTGRAMDAGAAPADLGPAVGANAPPRVRSVRFDPSRPKPGETVRAVVDAVDAEGDPVRIRHTWEIDGVRLPQRGAAIELGDVAKGSRITLSVVASDGRSDSEPAQASTRVENRPPRIESVALSPDGPVPSGAEVTAVVKATDPDGDPLHLRYEWRVDGRQTGAHGPTFETRGLQRGQSLQVRVVASDGDDEGEAVLSPPSQIANRPPEIVSAPGGLGPDGVFRYAVEARDPDGDRNLRFALDEAPPGMEIDPVLGQIVWTPGPEHRGNHVVQISVTDPQGGKGWQRFDLTVTARESDAQPPAAPADAPR